jgi:hypothetical protein
MKPEFCRVRTAHQLPGIVGFRWAVPILRVQRGTAPCPDIQPETRK